MNLVQRYEETSGREPIPERQYTRPIDPPPGTTCQDNFGRLLVFNGTSWVLVLNPWGDGGHQ